MTMLTASRRCCTPAKRGGVLRIPQTSMSRMVGSSTRARAAGLQDPAMIKLPTMSSGARIMARSNILTRSCTCVTSLVSRVMSLPVSSSSRLPKG